MQGGTDAGHHERLGLADAEHRGCRADDEMKASVVNVTWCYHPASGDRPRTLSRRKDPRARHSNRRR